jgi:chemotaxis protein CheZ
MAEPRKIFRIEETAAFRSDQPVQSARLQQLADIAQELSALRTMLTDAPRSAHVNANTSPHDEIGRLTGELRFVHAALNGATKPHEAERGLHSAVPPTRVVGELEAAVVSSEQAVQKILTAAEDIDQAANNLTAALKGDLERGLAQDIRDRVVQIFEACNYQDLTSQRLAKVIAAVQRVESLIGRALSEPERDPAAPPANGPPLPRDHGHVAQSEIDAMFEVQVKSA